MKTKTKKREYAPNQIVGTVIETEYWRQTFPFSGVSRSMTVAWAFSDTPILPSRMPMPIMAKPGDKFVFTIEPV